MIRLRNGLIGLAIPILSLGACAAPSAFAPPARAALVAVPLEAPPWRHVDASTGRISDLDGLIALSADFPNSASVQRRLLSAAVRVNNPAIARVALQRLEAMGYALTAAAFDSLKPVIGEAEARSARARAALLAERAGVSVPLIAIPERHRLVESVAWDARHSRLYVSTVVDRRLVTMDDNRGILLDIGGGSLFGMAVDEKRRMLWVGSGVVEQTPSPDTAFRGLIAVDLNGPVPTRRVPAPDGVSLGDIAVAADGTVYASDPVGGGLYRFRPDAEAMEAVVAPGTLRSPQGIALHPGGRHLYVSDYAYGIAIIDLQTGTAARLAATGPMMLDGTDGLFWFDGGLVAIQNGIRPMRIVRLSLADAGTVATAVEIIEANHPDWGEPTNGQIVDNDLLYVSEPQWERFGPGGKVKGAEPVRPNRIRITPLKNVPTLPTTR